MAGCLCLCVSGLLADCDGREGTRWGIDGRRKFTLKVPYSEVRHGKEGRGEKRGDGGKLGSHDGLRIWLFGRAGSHLLSVCSLRKEARRR